MDEDALFAQVLGRAEPQHATELPPARVPEGIVIPEKLRNLPVSRQLTEIDFNLTHFVAVAQTGAGKSIILPAVEIQMLKAAGWKGQVYFRQPTRTACRFLYSGMKTFWEPLGISIGIMTSDEKANLDADIVIYSDGSLKSVMTRNNRPIIVYFDEVHNMGTIATEIELALCKARGIPTRLLSATIDPAPLLQYLGPQTGLYKLDGRTFPINKEVRHVDRQVFWRDNKQGFKELMDDIIDEIIALGERALLFLPTKAMCEEVAKEYENRIATTFLHGEVNPAETELWVEKHANEPFLLCATLVAATSITIDVGRVYIWDERVDGEIVEGIERKYACRPDNNLLLQMAGRAGRIRAGDAVLISTTIEEDEGSDWHKPRDWSVVAPVPIITPGKKTTPYKVILSLAAHGVHTNDKIDLISKIDQKEMDHARTWLIKNGCIDHDGQMTRLGEWVERMPLDVPYAHFILTAPSDDARLALAAAICMSSKGAYQMVGMKPNSKELTSARIRKRNEFMEAEKKRAATERDANGLPVMARDAPPMEKLLPILPDYIVVKNSMPLTMARAVQGAYLASAKWNRDRSDSLPQFCDRSNLNTKIMRLVQRDLDGVFDHLGKNAKLDFMKINLTDPELFHDIIHHVRSHDLCVPITWDYKAWTRWRGHSAVMDAVAADAFGIKEGMQYTAVGIPKIIRSKKGNQPFVSLEFGTIVDGGNRE